MNKIEGGEKLATQARFTLAQAVNLEQALELFYFEFIGFNDSGDQTDESRVAENLKI